MSDRDREGNPNPNGNYTGLPQGGNKTNLLGFLLRNPPLPSEPPPPNPPPPPTPPPDVASRYESIAHQLQPQLEQQPGIRNDNLTSRANPGPQINSGPVGGNHTLRHFMQQQQNQMQARLQEAQYHDLFRCPPPPVPPPITFGQQQQQQSGSRSVGTSHQQRRYAPYQINRGVPVSSNDGNNVNAVQSIPSSMERSRRHMASQGRPSVSINTPTPTSEARNAGGGGGQPESNSQSPSTEPIPSSMVQLLSAQALKSVFQQFLALNKHVTDLIQLKGTIVELKDSNTELKHELRAIRKDSDTWAEENQALQGQLDTMKASMESLELLLTEKGSQLDEKSGQVLELTQDLQKSHDALNETNNELEKRTEALEKLKIKYDGQERSLLVMRRVQRELRKRKKNLNIVNKKHLTNLQKMGKKKAQLERHLKTLKFAVKKKNDQIYLLETEIESWKRKMNTEKLESSKYRAECQLLLEKVKDLEDKIEERDQKEAAKERILSELKDLLSKSTDTIEQYLEVTAPEQEETETMEAYKDQSEPVIVNISEDDKDVDPDEGGNKIEEAFLVGSLDEIEEGEVKDG